MTFDSVLTAITTVGFPIVCCVVMGWYVKYCTDKNREQIYEMNAQHKQEMSEFTKAIQNNTLAIQTLCDKLNG